MLDQCVVPQIAAAMKDLCEQVMVWRVVHDNIGAAVFLNDTVKSDDAWVGACDLVKCNLAYVDLPLAGRLMGL